MLNDVFTKNYTFRSRKISNQNILFASGFCYELNDTGTFIWENISDQSVNEIIEMLAKEYEVNPEDIKDDVINFINFLIEKKAIIKDE
ncbi:PqqD family protein [Alkaliphilus hydrothermalis]|uniref:Coenzyme PQQ synthesis protein D (PqqD) n=1 Tax=Alkaliphilus hydrothermalis TaxID=1482730 RepID=A0ABS2NTC0_9FIRM|nr:PqqD family protein [Alkaliphilus hydrothermalis]MBM7616200.1 hypothetical protein [Alkaliphilus hydrothermalis]